MSDAVDTWPAHELDAGAGAEVVDLGQLPGYQGDRLTNLAARTPVPEVASLQSDQYEWAHWLARVLRGAGVHVVELDGWRFRGRPLSVGPFKPRGVLWHHDASAVGPSPGLAEFIALVGRPPEVPAPLSQVWVCVGCRGRHPVGTWHLLAAGRANHGGEGAGWGEIPTDAANTWTIGIETDNTVGEPTPDMMYASLVRGTAAILNHLRSRPGEWLAGHKEFARGRKIDPDDIDMGKARDDVRRVMRRLAGDDPDDPDDLVPYPGPVFEVGRKHDAVRLLRGWLERLPAGDELADRFRSPRLFTEGVRDAVRRFQRAHDELSDDPDGIPGPITWRMIQRAAQRVEKPDSP